MKHIQLFEEFNFKSDKTSLKAFMKKYPVGTTFTFDGGYKFKITDFDSSLDNDVVGTLRSPNGKLLDENNTKNHDAILLFLEYDWKVFNENKYYVKENILPRPYKKIKCLECGEEVCDNLNYKIGHLYNKHFCKPSVGDYKAKRMLKQYFPK